MGNHVPKFEWGQIYVRTEKPFYFAGEQVNGTIYLDLQRPYPGKKLFLKIKGKEETWWEEHRSRQKRKENGETEIETWWSDYDGKNEFYRHKIPIFKTDQDMIGPGQMAYPFSFMLGNELPGSFYDKETHLKAIIKYKVKCELEPHDSKEIKSMKFTQELVIREPLKKAIDQKVGEMSVDIKTWCCCNQGKSYIKCYFEKDTYIPGEEARIFCELDNSQCKLSIKEVRVQLMMNVLLREKKKGKGHVKRHNECVSQISMPGIGAGQTALDEQKNSYIIKLDDYSNKKGLQPTTNGSLITCKYYLIVTSVTDGCTCCFADPNVECKTQIVAAPPMYYQEFNPQEYPNWNPQVQPTFDIAWKQDYAYQSNKGGEYIQPTMGINQYQDQSAIYQQQDSSQQQMMQPFQPVNIDNNI